MPEPFPAETLAHPASPIAEPRMTLHAVMVRDAEARFDDEAIYGRSAVESGIEWVGRDPDPEDEGLERWGVVWIAVRHEPDGTRAYTGVTAARLWVDPIARKGYKDSGHHTARLDAARQGRVELEPLGREEKEAGRQAMLRQDPDAWDQAHEAVLEAFRTRRGGGPG
jgi:hypothetical protein